ncbi:MAG: hypothetical protein KF860_04275 [Cyclobacteriaceae bacterium]|nr:hypothetical protein [Cyclobacteriaceae bacterium]
MHSLQFWNSWARIYKLIGLVIGTMFVFSLLFLWYSWFISPNPALSWYTVQELETTQVPAHTFQQGLLELTIHGDNFLIFGRLLGEPLQPNVVSGYIFLSILVVSMIMLLAIVTTLSRFWYLIGMGLFILFIAGFRMEIISVFGQPNKLFTVITLILFCIPSFYFQFFNTAVAFSKRLLFFTGITLLLGLLIVNFSTVKYPLLHLSVTGITAGILISVVFILMVAHEILASFVFIASQSSKQGKSLNHFLIISSIYMINLALAYAHRIGSIDWNIMYVNFYLLISISGILGLWGFRQRHPQYEKIIDADPFGIYLFLSLGTICFTTIAYFINTANDPVLVTINDAIIYGHIGYGIIFLTYVISNFMGMLAKNVSVHKILYKPNNMPYFTFRFGGIIATLAFVFYNTWQAPVQNAFSGYYNAVGDLYQTLNNDQFAEAFYQQSNTYGYLNHHANYAMANLEAKKNYNTLKERNFYKHAAERRPTEFAYINLSQTYQRNEQWLEARLILNEALKHFPESGTIKNALGIIYSKMDLVDSSLYYLQKASNQRIIRDAANANFIGVAAKNNLPVNADSLFTLISSDNIGIRSNALAFANIQGTKIKMNIDLKQDTLLNLFSASLLNNYMLNHLGELDSTFINHVINLGEKPINKDYSESLLFNASLSLYADGQTRRAFSLLENITIFSEDQDKYNTILAMWSLENKAWQDAATFINYVANQQSSNALPVAAIALTEAERISDALIRWDSLKSNPGSTYYQFATQMIKALKANTINSLNDEEKLAYCNYRISPYDSISFKVAMAQIENEELKARAILYRSQKLFEIDETNAAIDVFEKISGLRLVDKNLYNQIQLFELELLANKGDIQVLSQRLNESKIEFPSHRKSLYVYFSALQSELNKDTTTAKLQFKWLASANPYLEDAVISSARYFKENGKDNLLPYTILTDALLANPFSVKLLKAYSMEAAQLGFSEYANSSLERLRPLISAESLRKFLIDNQHTFAQVIQ